MPPKNKRRHRRYARTHLASILLRASPEAPIRERLEWFRDLMEWISRPAQKHLIQRPGAPVAEQLLRVQYILSVLEKNEPWQREVARTIRSIIADTQAIDLFSHTGIPLQSGLPAELAERFANKFLPIPPYERDLGDLLFEWFPVAEHAAWIECLDEPTMRAVSRLVLMDEEPDEQGWNTLLGDMEDALLLLSAHLQAEGLSSHIRSRLSQQALRQLPFYDLPRLCRAFIEQREGHQTQREAAYEALTRCLEACASEMAHAYQLLSRYGVSIGIVYRLERMKALLERLRMLSRVLRQDFQPAFLFQFVSYLIAKSAAQRSIRVLFQENFAILSKRIVERNAHTGHHYITRTATQYWNMVKRAAGGGLVTGPVVVLKIFAEGLAFAPFINGLVTSINYAASFVVIQACGFTLATKQPAMTAPAIAGRLAEAERQRSVRPLLDELTHLSRSQFAAVLGNVFSVIPAAILIHFLGLCMLGHPIIPAEEAQAIIDKHSILGLTPLYAAFTGVLLWLSSLVAGYVDNWSAYRQFPEAIANSRRLRRAFGTRRTEALAALLQKQLPNLGGNVSLGFLLGMTPQLLDFIGIAAQVRHITLSTGMVTFALMSLGWEQANGHDLLLAILGLAVSGILNVAVSFGLALAVAISARRIPAVDREGMVRAFRRRFSRQPLSFFFPVGIKDEPKHESLEHS